MVKKKEKKADSDWNPEGLKEPENKADELWDEGANPEFQKEKEPDDKSEGIAGEKPKQNKKLVALWDDVAAKWNVLNKFLMEQGLGQNARQKVVELVKEIRVVQDKIVKEEE